MRYRRRRWKKRRSSGWKKPTKASPPKAPSAAAISHLYGGIDKDVRRCFYDLPEATLKAVFKEYSTLHGTKKCEYAKRTYEKWRSGSVEMSGVISERLLALVPRFLEFGAKYDLVAKLWRKNDSAWLRVQINPAIGIDRALETVLGTVDSLNSGGIPDVLVGRLNWLSENDAVVAQDLFKQVRLQEYALTRDSLLGELRQLFAVFQAADESAMVHARRLVKIPGGTVEILIDPTTFVRSTSMSQNNPEKRDLVPSDQPKGQVAPIQDPNNLLSEALRRMPEEKRAEIIGKAADEALRLQVKSAENKVDQDILAQKMDMASQKAREVAENRDVEIHFSTEHKSKEGDTRITVKSKPTPPPQAQTSPKWCFVATACFGDFDHPLVIELRQFRDQVLMKSRGGAAFTNAYYRFGPYLASVLEAMPVLKVPSRFILTLLVRMLKRTGLMGD